MPERRIHIPASWLQQVSRNEMILRISCVHLLILYFIRYYTCYSGQSTYIYQCNGDLLFDLVYNGCNYAELTYCGDRVRPNGTTSVSTTTIKASTSYPTIQPPISCLDDGFYPADRTKCTQGFYICLDGYAYSNVSYLFLALSISKLFIFYSPFEALSFIRCIRPCWSSLRLTKFVSLFQSYRYKQWSFFTFIRPTSSLNINTIKSLQF